MADPLNESQFLVRTACPPTTEIFLQGGWFWYPPTSGVQCAIRVPSKWLDLNDLDDYLVSGAYYNSDYTFKTAYTFLPAVLQVYLDYTSDRTGYDDLSDYGTYLCDPLLRLYGTSYTTIPYLDECATAAEAEAILDAMLDDGAQALGGDTVTVGRIVLRSNGNLAVSNQFLPVDPVNRGRSYLYGVRDVRAVWKC